MILTTSYKSNHFLWLVLKVLIAFASFYFIFEKLTQNSKISFVDFLSNLNDFNLFSLKNITFLVILSVFNWFFEILKWKVLASKIQFISLKEAMKQALSSLSFSLLTPNRIGEYGAKAYFFPKEKWKEILVLNGIGNGYQLLITCFFGIIGYIFFYETVESIFTNFNFQIAILILFAITLLFSFSWIRKQIKKVRVYLKTFSFKFHFKIGCLSILRYLIFSHQFYFILIQFQPELLYWNTFAAITLIYLISSIIPMLSIFDVVVKSSVAIWVLSWLQIDTSIALTTTLLMWILNFAIPAILGSFYILRLHPKWK